MQIMQLPEILDLRAASPLASSLLALRGQQLTIDASGVQRLGAQCIQVLLSAKATWAADGTSFTVANPSEAFAESLSNLGISTTMFTEQELSR